MLAVKFVLILLAVSLCMVGVASAEGPEEDPCFFSHSNVFQAEEWVLVKANILLHLSQEDNALNHPNFFMNDLPPNSPYHIYPVLDAPPPPLPLPLPSPHFFPSLKTGWEWLYGVKAFNTKYCCFFCKYCWVLSEMFYWVSVASFKVFGIRNYLLLPTLIFFMAYRNSAGDVFSLANQQKFCATKGPLIFTSNHWSIVFRLYIISCYCNIFAHPNQCRMILVFFLYQSCEC